MSSIRNLFFSRISIVLWKTCNSNPLFIGSLILSYFRNLFFIISFDLRKTYCNNMLIIGSFVLSYFRISFILRKACSSNMLFIESLLLNYVRNFYFFLSFLSTRRSPKTFPCTRTARRSSPRMWWIPSIPPDPSASSRVSSCTRASLTTSPYTRTSLRSYP